jgi:transposase
MAWRAVTDEQWERIQARLPRRKRGRAGGRPPVDDRRCFEGILWILWTGAPWSELPEKYGSKSTVHRRLKAWAESGVLLDLWRAFLDQLDDRHKVQWDECFIDGMFMPAKKGAHWWGRLQKAREQSPWYWPMAKVLRSEYTWTRHPRRKSGSLSRR